MKKIYVDPEMQVRNYLLPPRNVVMTSDTGNNSGGDNDLEDGDFFE